MRGSNVRVLEATTVPAPGIGGSVTRQPAPSFSRAYRTWMLTLLVTIWSIIFLDRSVIATLSQAIKLDLKISDFQIGLLQGLGPTVFNTVLGLAIARLAERKSRVIIISSALMLWSIAVASGSLARSFSQLVIVRLGVGVSDTGFMAPITSLLGDHYGPKQRASAWSIINLSAPIGALSGGILGGWIAENYGWRLALLIVAVPGLMLGFVSLATLREPPRGYAEGGVATGSTPPPLIEAVRGLLGKPAFRHVLLAGGLATFGVGTVAQFLFTFIIRTFPIGFAKAGLVFGIVSFFSLSLGLLVGGFGGDRLVRRDERWYAWAPAVALLIGAPLHIAAFLQTQLAPAAALATLGSVFVYIFPAPTSAMIQNMASPLTRASAVYLYGFCLGIGAGVGSALVGLLSDIFARQTFNLGDYPRLCPGSAAAPGASAAIAEACRSASAHGIRNALLIASLSFALSAVHFFLASRTLRNDVHRPMPISAPIDAEITGSH
jgi:predicted MFS family arabinose efflux permease